MSIEHTRLLRGWVALVLAAPLAAQEWTPRQMLPIPQGPGVTLSAREAEADQVRFEVRGGGRRDAVDLPFRTLVTASRVVGGYLVAGVTPAGTGQVLAVAARGDGLQLLPQVLATEADVPFRVTLAAGRIVVWLGDGRILTAKQSALGDFPAWSSFQRVGSRSVPRHAFPETAGLTVADAERILVRLDPRAEQHTFVLEPSGEWLEALRAARRVLPLEMRTPVHVGGSNTFRADVAGAVFLEEEGAAEVLPLSENGTAGPWHGLAADVSARLRADRRYRLGSGSARGRWFRPERHTGTPWSAPGASIDAIDVDESEVRFESGACTLRSRLTWPVRDLQVVTGVWLLSTSQHAEPPVIERGGRTWLVPDAIATSVHEVHSQANSRGLSVRVPLHRTAAAGATWLHVQLVARSAQGTVAGATTVRSVPVLPDADTSWATQEQHRRESAVRLWEELAVADPRRLLEELMR